MPDIALSRRQRMAPPIDRWHARRLESGGGYETMSPRTLAPGIETDLSRYPGTVFDALIRRDRTAFYAAPRFIPPPVTWISWTQAGPTRPELGMRNATLREMGGNTRSRYPVVPGAPTTGMHTMTPSAASRNVPRYQDTAQMVPGRYDRLRASQYSGQTFSQTTRIQGG